MGSDARVPDEIVPCICPRFGDTGGFRIADLGCPTHGVDGTNPGDGYWGDQHGDEQISAPEAS